MVCGGWIQTAAKLLTKDEGARIAANIAKLPSAREPYETSNRGLGFTLPRFPGATNEFAVLSGPESALPIHFENAYYFPQFCGASKECGCSIHQPREAPRARYVSSH
jgi:hypothetical protein